MLRQRCSIKIIQGAFCLGMIIALAGCMQVFPTVQAVELPTQVPTSVGSVETFPLGEEQVSPTETVSVIETTPVEVTSPPEVTPSETDLSETPTVSPTVENSPGISELRATNPANVNLASGKVQLVEFFAFW